MNICRSELPKKKMKFYQTHARCNKCTDTYDINIFFFSSFCEKEIPFCISNTVVLAENLEFFPFVFPYRHTACSAVVLLHNAHCRAETSSQLKHCWF